MSRWHKLMWNIPFNGLSVVLDASTKELIDDPDTVALADAIVREVHAAAGTCGFDVPEEAIRKTIDVTRSMVPYDSSMRLDYLNHRPMEVEAIFGNPLREASRRVRIDAASRDALPAAEISRCPCRRGISNSRLPEAEEAVEQSRDSTDHGNRRCLDAAGCRRTDHKGELGRIELDAHNVRRRRRLFPLSPRLDRLVVRHAVPPSTAPGKSR